MLQGLPWIVRCLYFELRAHMDFATGLVGAVPGAGVSWRALQEALYVEPHQGLESSGAPTKARVRRAMAWLERLGAIEDRTRGKRLIFFMPLATRDRSARNKPGTNPAHLSRHTKNAKPGTPESSNGAGFQHKAGTPEPVIPAYPQHSKPGTHPVSGGVYINSLVDHPAREADPVDNSEALPKQDRQLAAWARRHGYPGPPRGASYAEYRQELTRLISQRRRAARHG